MHQPRRSRLAPGLVALMIILLGASSAACAGRTAVPVATPPSAAPSAASSPAGPSSYAAWVARQGFGGTPANVQSGGGFAQQGVFCVGPITYIGQEEVKRDIEYFKAGLQGANVTEPSISNEDGGMPVKNETT